MAGWDDEVVRQVSDLTSMLAKEHSMSRYKEWDAYYQSSGMLLPPLSAILGIGDKTAE